jgi:hypothetical protein
MTDVMWSRQSLTKTELPSTQEKNTLNPLLSRIWAVHIWLSEPLRRQIHSELYLLFGTILLVGWLILSPADIGSSWYMAMALLWPVSMAIGIFRLRIVFLRSIFR